MLTEDVLALRSPRPEALARLRDALAALEAMAAGLPVVATRVGCVPELVSEATGRLVEAGYRSHVQPFDAFWGQRYATVLDPDGNPVDLYAAL